jgi:two-component system chemotaxis sensor kinase CheA
VQEGSASWTAAPPAQPDPGEAARSHGTAKSDAGQIRVQVSQLDKLMALAGELVLTRNALVQSVAARDLDAISGVAQRVDALTSELQDGIMLTRMQPIGAAFGRFRRIVRDLARQLGKSIDLSIEGEDVEVDKSIIEAIGDPLTHLIRNAADHGIEAPQDRLASGKPEAGRLRLRAFHEAGQVRIEVEDDGAGIPPAKIKAKALESGLKTASELAAMDDKDVLMLIFAPGFSTASSVSEVSGRGVGMDVVQSSLAKVGGAVEIDSRPGLGTCFRIRLPLTLAIIPSLLVLAGGERFAIPQANVQELVRVPCDDAGGGVHRLGGLELIRLRGELLPLVDLGEVLGIAADPPGPREGMGYSARYGGDARRVVVVSANGFKYGLRVDSFLDSMEIVVKPFGKHLAKCTRYAGATILGDGQVALILDVVGLGRAAGMQDALTPAEAAETDAARPVDGGASAGRSFLLVKDGRNGTFALPMEQVVRIERMAAARIETLGRRMACTGPGGSLALFSLAESTGGTSRPEEAHAYAVAFRAGGRQSGLLVSEVLDTVQSEGGVDEALCPQPGILGTVLIDGRLTLVPDLEGLAAAPVPGPGMEDGGIGCKGLGGEDDEDQEPA